MLGVVSFLLLQQVCFLRKVEMLQFLEVREAGVFLFVKLASRTVTSSPLFGVGTCDVFLLICVSALL